MRARATNDIGKAFSKKMTGEGLPLTARGLTEPTLFLDILSAATWSARIVLVSVRAQRRASEASDTPSTDISASEAAGVSTANGARST